MESKEFHKKIKISIFHLYYYLFYNYNPSKVSSFLLALMDIFQLFSINLNERVKFVFIGIFLFLKLLRDVYKRRLIKEFKVQLSILRYFLLYNIYIFYYPILRKKYIF